MNIISKIYQYRIWAIAAMLLLMTLSACEQVRNIDFPLPYEGDRLVAYAFLSPEQPVNIFLYKTQPTFADSYQYRLSDATVSLQQSQEAPWLLAPGENSYLSPEDYRPVVGQTYTLRASVPGIPAIEGRASDWPSPVEIQQVSYGIDPDSNQIQLQVTWTDPPGPDYYFVEAIRYRADTAYQRSGTGLRNTWGPTQAFSDTLSNGILSRNFELSISTCGKIGTSTFLPCDRVEVVLYHVSKPVFLLFKSISEGNNAVIGSWNSPDAPLYSNIDGGYGAIGTFTADTVEVVW